MRFFLHSEPPGCWVESCCCWSWSACYLTALSWADLTFVLPATSLAYVAVAIPLQVLAARADLARALVGHSPDNRRSRLRNPGTGIHSARVHRSCMMNLSSGPAIAVMIGAIVLTATAGDVLLASAMRAVGDLDRIKAARRLTQGRSGPWSVKAVFWPALFLWLSASSLCFFPSVTGM